MFPEIYAGLPGGSFSIVASKTRKAACPDTSLRAKEFQDRVKTGPACGTRWAELGTLGNSRITFGFLTQ